jgi:hypothetical protein
MEIVKTYSQNGEEFVIEALLMKDISPSKFLVELGAGDGYHLSNSRYFIEKGWKGILIDADNRGNSDVKQHKITRENINSLLKTYQCPKEFDFLSVDLDGNDYWIIEEILQRYSPKLIVAEFNASFESDCSKTIKYDSEFIWQGDNYFGFTLEAGRKLAQENGYTLMLQHADMNIFLLRNDYAKEFTSKQENFRYEKSDYFKKSDRVDWVTI